MPKIPRFNPKPYLRPFKPAAPFVAKTAAIGGAGIGLVAAGSGLVREYGDRNQAPPVSHDVHEGGSGTTIRTEDGGTAFYPSEEMLAAFGQWAEKLAEAAAAGYNPGLDPFSDPVIDPPLTSDQSADVGKHEATIAGLTNPVTLLIIGAIVIGALYVKKK